MKHQCPQLASVEGESFRSEFFPPSIRLGLIVASLTISLLVPDCAHSQGKAAIAKEAAEMAKKVWDIVGGVNRSGVIHIQNDTAFQLSNPKTYVFSGNVENLDIAKEIPKGKYNVVGVKKSDNGAAGAVGVLTYKIENTKKRLAICYSIPYDYNLYENWYKYSIIGEGTAVNKALYTDMYYNNHDLTSGDIAKASSGENSWTTDGFVMKGTMETSGQADIHLYLSGGPKPPAEVRPKTRAATQKPIPVGAAVYLRCVKTDKYLGKNKDDYATMSSSSQAYKIVRGGGAKQIKADSTQYTIKLGDKLLYETSKGNAGFWDSDDGTTTRWTFKKVKGTSGSVVCDGDIVIIYNGNWKDNYLCDYGNGFAGAGKYPKPKEWIVSTDP